jgi:DNA-binding CsgD family transcriptional regulator
MTPISDFFAPISPITGVKQSDYLRLKYHIDSLIAIARMIDLSFYIIDYKKQEFVYVSENPLFLSGYDRSEVQQMGYSFYSKVVPPDDLEMLLEINQAGFGFYYDLPPERRPNGFISYDFRMTNTNGGVVMVNHKLTPFILNEEGNLWISLCLVTLSSVKKPGNMFIYMQDESVKYNYSFKLKKFVVFKNKPLTQIESKVIQLLSLGMSSKDIANQICISINTVKFHKKRIFAKLEVQNSNEAVYLYTIQKTLQ